MRAFTVSESDGQSTTFVTPQILVRRSMKTLRKLLLVDDEPVVHRAVRLGLGGEFEIVTRMSVEEALADLEEPLDRGVFDVVFLDVRMPGVLDGADLFRRLQRIDPARAPSVVVMTGYSQIARMGGTTLRTTCLPKPFSAEELRRAISQLTWLDDTAEVSSDMFLP
jgi:CheY-like chemotaxis protein